MRYISFVFLFMIYWGASPLVLKATSVTAGCPSPVQMIKTLQKRGDSNFLKYDMKDAQGVTVGLYKIPFYYTNFRNSDVVIKREKSKIQWELTCHYADPVGEVVFSGNSSNSCCVGTKCVSLKSGVETQRHCNGLGECVVVCK